MATKDNTETDTQILIAVRVTAKNEGHECGGMRFYKSPIQFYAPQGLIDQVKDDNDLTLEVIQ
jgi:hypothetical protein